MKAMTATTQKNRHIPHPTTPVGSKQKSPSMTSLTIVGDFGLDPTGVVGCKPKSPSMTSLTIVHSIVKTKRRKTMRATIRCPQFDENRKILLTLKVLI